jgi:hypothetical protein
MTLRPLKLDWKTIWEKVGQGTQYVLVVVAFVATLAIVVGIVLK